MCKFQTIDFWYSHKSFQELQKITGDWNIVLDAKSFIVALRSTDKPIILAKTNDFATITIGLT